MCFKPSKQDDRARARERLAQVRTEDRTPTEVSRGPRGNREPDRDKQERSEERLLSVIGN
jgi:hypothetical protein